MKKYFASIIASIVTVASLSSAQTIESQTTLDKIVAIVDKEIVTLSDLNFSIQQIAIQNRLDPKSPELRDRVLDGLINDKLVLAQAIEDSVVVTDEEVTETLERQLTAMVQQAGSKERLEEMYGMPLNRIRRDYQYRDLIRKKLLVQKIQQSRQSAVTVSRREVEEFFETYKDSIPKVPKEYELSHIFIEPKADSGVVKEIYTKAAAVADSIRAGGDFAEFAKRYSSDGSASQGGDLGFARRGAFVKEFEEVAFSLKEKEISKPVKTQFGYHIIQMVERRGESVHTRHILFPITTTQANDDSTKALLVSLKKRIEAGEVFGALAKKYSQDPETKDIGGDLGKVSIDQLDQSYAEIVTSLKPGQFSEPHRLNVGNKYGFHIIYLRSFSPEHTINLNDDYRRLEQLTMQFKINTNYQQWIDELRKNIYWEKKL